MDDKSQESKKTERAEEPVIPSGVATAGTGTQTGAGPVITAGIQPQIISAGIALATGNEIVLNDKHYKILKVISKSTGESEVYLVEHETQKYIFKHYYPNFKPKDSILVQLKGLNHPDIVNLVDYGYLGDRFWEVMEYAEGGSLMDIKPDGGYKYIPIKDINRLKEIIKETVNALNFCHSKGIIHRDIKPGNIFFKNPDGTNVLIGDFGISSALDEGLSKRLSGQARTAIYAAPELYQSIGGKTIIGKEIDYYALGISLIHIWTGEEPFKDQSEYALMGVKMNGMVDIPDDMPEDLKNLVKGLITIEPIKRWGYDEIQRWLKGEYVPVYYKRVELKFKDFHFGIIDGVEAVVNTPEDLAKLMEKHPEQGKRHLYKGTIQNWVQGVNESLYLDIRSIVEDDYPVDQDAGLTKAIYILDPAKKYKTFAGVECRTAEEIGDAIEQESSYYKNYLTQKKNADLFLYLEARGAKDVADTFRKYAQAYNPKRAFNMMVLYLQGSDKFKLGSMVFFKPEDILAADDATKDKLARMLTDPDSKFSIWLEQFSNLKDNIDNWRKLGRVNSTTLSYALEEKSPFHFFNDLAYSVEDFKKCIEKYIVDKNYHEQLTNTSFMDTADFWLKSYHNTTYEKVMLDYLTEAVEKGITSEDLRLKEFSFQFYQKEVEKGITSEDLRNQLEKISIWFINKTHWKKDRATKGKFVSVLKKINPNHKLVQRYSMEEKIIFQIYRKEIDKLNAEEKEELNKIEKQKTKEEINLKDSYKKKEYASRIWGGERKPRHTRSSFRNCFSYFVDIIFCYS